MFPRVEYGRTALHNAPRGGNLWADDLLLETGTDIAHPDIEGETVLHTAALFGHAELVKTLIQKGASIPTCTKQGDTVLDNAVKGALSCHNGDIDYAKMLACILLGFEMPLKESKLDWRFGLAEDMQT